jgi:hypothetical protein
MAHEIFVSINLEGEFSFTHTYFSDVRFIYLTRVSLEVLSLYQSKSEAIKIQSEKTIHALTSVFLFERFLSVNIIQFLSYCLTLLNKLVRYLWFSTEIASSSDTERILRTICVIVKSINEFGFTLEFLDESLDNIAHLCKISITDL